MVRGSPNTIFHSDLAFNHRERERVTQATGVQVSWEERWRMLTIVSLCPVLTQFRFGKHPAGTPAVCLTDTEKKLHRETEPMVKFT